MRKVLTRARRHWRLRSVTALAAVGAMTASTGVVLLGAATAQVNADEPCVPQDAWTEITGWVAASPGAGWYEVDRRVTPGTDPVPEVVEYEFRLLTKPAVAAVTENDDTWYTYNPGKDADANVTTGWPTGVGDVDKANGWQVDNGNHQGQYDHDGFKVEVPWEEGSGSGSWFFVDRTEVVVVPASPAMYEYRWALGSPGKGWEATGNSRVVQAYVPGIPAVSEYKFAFDHPAVTCDDTPPPPPATDVCLNIDGVQEEVPPGYTVDDDGDCAQIAGEDEVVPEPKPEPKPDKAPAVETGDEPTVAGVQAVAPPAAAPTAVAAGLAGGTGLTTGQLLGQSLAGLGLVILLAAGGLEMSRRTAGAHLN